MNNTQMFPFFGLGALIYCTVFLIKIFQIALLLIIVKISWRRAWNPIPVFLPKESHVQRSLASTVMGSQRVRHD